MRHLKYEGTFLGVGKKKGTGVAGLIFGDVLEAIGCRISSLIMVHPDDIIPSHNIRSKALIARAREIFREFPYFKSDEIYYPAYQIKVLTLPKDKETVLVVDDNPCIREVLQEELDELGYYSVVASGVKEALEILDCTLIDKIIIDLVMPVISGETLLFNVLEEHPNIDIILISGNYDKLELLREELPETNIPIVKKPCTLSNLNHALSVCGVK